ncbi:GYD domain-containing protein [Haloplanus halophilus]|uniref:GYD domain-containing protein n=1 Tax=Haloplanus halophilus TaxID=2949993 RepID=UPI002041DD88|nr:GYD domain-containing protein [Haloplanus sp. GDY1]
MSQQPTFTTYVALIDVADPNVQNMQELASVWGDITREFDRIGASIEDAYAALGEHDFLVIFDGSGTETAFQADVILERHGLDVQTMEVVDTETFSELVTDL